MKLTLATLILAAALTLTGCQATPTTNTKEVNQVAVSEKNATGDGVNDKPIIRCGSTLTKTKQPCQRRVKEDSFCHLHSKAESEREKKQ